MHQKFLLFFILLFSVAAVHAQLCQGSLGDPVIDIDFGSGGNPGAPLPAATTNYSYVNFDCPNDGSYTIRSNTQSCFDNSWYTLTADHTGNANGYFMLVNASIQPNDFYLDTVHGLCPNTTFEFAAWVLNILRSSACPGNQVNPNLNFIIEHTDGTGIDSFQTGTIYTSSSPTWKQYGFYFTTRLNESDVIIRIKNTAPGGCGNDLALDDITFRPCGPMLDASISGNTQSNTVNVCDGSSYTYTFNCNVSEGYPNPSFQWQENSGTGWNDIPNETNNTLTETLTDAGSYQFRLAVAASGNITSSTCRIYSNILQININAHPVPSVKDSGSSCIGQTLNLTASGGSTYLWSGPDNFSSSQQTIALTNFSAAQQGLYHVNITSAAGCTSVDSFTANAYPNPVATLINDTTICSGTSINLNGSGGIKYLWQPSSDLSSATIADPSASPNDSTKYTLTVTDANGCTDTASVNINVLQSPSVSADGDKTISEGQSVQINATVSGADISYYWSPDVFINDPYSLHPIVDPPSDTTYTLLVTSNAGCGAAAVKVFIRVYEKLSIPNAFSPNGDGINDTWKITPIDTYPNAEISVFNRYGQIVFHTTNYAPWNGTYNGKPLSPGTYYYLIDLKVPLPKITGWLLIVK